MRLELVASISNPSPHYTQGPHVNSRAAQVPDPDPGLHPHALPPRVDLQHAVELVEVEHVGGREAQGAPRVPAPHDLDRLVLFVFGGWMRWFVSQAFLLSNRPHHTAINPDPTLHTATTHTTHPHTSVRACRTRPTTSALSAGCKKALGLCEKCLSNDVHVTRSPRALCAASAAVSTSV